MKLTQGFVSGLAIGLFVGMGGMLLSLLIQGHPT